MARFNAPSQFALPLLPKSFSYGVQFKCKRCNPFNFGIQYVRIQMNNTDVKVLPPVGYLLVTILHKKKETKENAQI